MCLLRRPFACLHYTPGQVDLYRDCPFWDDIDKCASKDCIIQGVDEVCIYVSSSGNAWLTLLQSKIPVKWRTAALGKVGEPSLSMVRTF